MVKRSIHQKGEILSTAFKLKYIKFSYFLVRLVVSGNNLIISSAQQSDEGRYQCIARNIAGVRHSTQALLSVYGEHSRLY